MLSKSATGWLLLGYIAAHLEDSKKLKTVDRQLMTRQEPESLAHLPKRGFCVLSQKDRENWLAN